MPQQFPSDPAEKRKMLFQLVDDVRETLAAGAEEAERLRTLPAASVAALRDSGLIKLKLPAELGGAEADPVTQLEIIEEIARIDPSTGWVFGLQSAGVALTAFLSEEVLQRVCKDNDTPFFAGALTPGHAVRVDGGYRLSGQWSWASGIQHSGWITPNALLDKGEGQPPSILAAIVPASDIEIIDNWNVVGLKGTGSCDFRADNVFVPDAFAMELSFDPDMAMKPLRGGPTYNLGFAGLALNVLPGFAFGVARRALDEIAELAISKQRGFAKKVTLADRAVFQRFVGEANLRLRAVRSLYIDLTKEIWDTLLEGGRPPVKTMVELRGATAMVFDVSRDVVGRAFYFGGGSSVRLESMLQRCLRDINVGATHYYVNDVAYELHGQSLLGFPNVNPMS